MQNGLNAAPRADLAHAPTPPWLAALLRMIKNYPHRVATVVAALLVSSAGGAYAVAELGPDASDIPVRQVLQAIQPSALAAQGGEQDSFNFTLFRSETTRSSDTPESLLQRLGVFDPQAAAFLRTDPYARAHIFGRAGRTVSVETTNDHHLSRLTVRWTTEEASYFQRLRITKTDGGFRSRIDAGSLTASNQLASGTIQSSLFAATDDARIPDAVATQLAEIFSADIDFHRALRKGDRFSVVYETLSADGEPLRSGKVLSAEFSNDGKIHQAIWFQEPGSKGAYYTLAGQSMRRAYLASPVEFSRISSGFKMRFHPILQKWAAHLGTDYAAPTGTAVRSVGDGVVEFAGSQNGFGNVVFVKHRNQNTTVYAHLSKINVKRGQTVAQGQNVGAVGSTGWATGPHLHFEFRVDGVHQDPMTIAKQNDATPVSAAARASFDRFAASMRMELAAAATVRLASAQ